MSAKAAPSLSPAQRTALRAQAHALKPVVLIGAEGLTESVLAETERNLIAHELIKIRVFGDDRAERVAIYEAICERLKAAPVQHIGKLLLVYRPAPAAHAELPSAGRALAGALATSTAPKGRAPRVVKIVKPGASPSRRPKPQKVLVRGNERMTAGGTVKRAKPRQASAKRQHQDIK
jgi:RNA-binding protein